MNTQLFMKCYTMKATSKSSVFDKIRKWAWIRGLYQQGNSNTQ